VANTTRTTISVPAGLKRRMDAIKEPVNWSAIACRAFEHKLAEIITRRGAKSMNDVIARLRASKEETETVEYQLGHTAGRDWAAKKAKVPELKHLEALWDQLLPYDWDSWCEEGDNDAYSLAERIYFTLRPDEGRDRSRAELFWSETVGENYTARDAEFYRGFAKGAIHLWREVSDRV